MYQMPVLEIYLDALFILNFMMDYFIFWMVSKTTYQKVSRKRLLLGAGVAASLYCLVVVVPLLRKGNIIFYLILLPLIPIGIIFKPSHFKQWFQMFIISNIIALTVGGMSYGIFYWIQEQDIILTSYKKRSDKFSMGTLFISIIASYAMIQLYKYYMQKRNTGIQKLYPLKIRYNGQAVTIQALLDTGNKVYDPISKDPVIIVEYSVLQELLPENIRAMYLNKEKDVTCIAREAGQCEFGLRIRLIPYHSLGNPNGLLLGFKADEVYLDYDGLQNKLVEDVIIAIYQHDLSMEDTYHALLHADLVG